MKLDTTKAIASAVEKQVAVKMKAIEKEKAKGDETEAYIMSIIKKYSAGNNEKAKVSNTTAVAPPPTLKGILKRVKNTKIETGT